MTLPGTAVTRLLGVRHPVLLAPMGSVAGGALAAAVTQAGGLGLLGPGYADAPWIEREFRETAGVRVGIGFIAWDLQRDPSRLEVALVHRPVLVMLSFGDPTPFVGAIHDAGVLVAVQVQSVRAARHAARAGADLIVAQGTEAGGHGASRALFPLLPAVVDAVSPLPVVAAGGIADGRGLAASLALGAGAVLVGTRFYATEESLAAPDAKRRVVTGSGDQTVRTRVFDVVREIDWPAPFTGRALGNDFTRRWHGQEAELGGRRDEFRRYADATQRGDFDTAVVWAGEGVDLVREVVPAARVVSEIVTSAEEILGNLAGGVGSVDPSPGGSLVS
jgi:nitronate monooxygenase